jgi:hypothetical protein
MRNVWVLLLGCCALRAIARAEVQDSDWGRMKPITPREYVCYRAKGPITIDGKADEASWADAPWTEDFVDIEGPGKTIPRFRTRAKMLWDDQYLYVYAELQEPHVWGTITKKNEVIFRDNDFEVFINPDGSNHNYYEYEMNALNAIWELTLDRPYRDDGPVHLGTNMEGLKSAVHVDGTINDPSDTDRGWSVEIAYPWKGLAKYATTAACPPVDGEQWRMGFSRVEWVIDIIDGKYRKVPNRAEDNWIWSPQGVVDMHRPERWGFVQFSTAEPGKAQIHPDPTLPARDRLMEIYYLQRTFHKAHGRYALSLEDLGVSDPAIQMTARPAEYTATTRADSRIVHVRQDSKLWVDQEQAADANGPASASEANLPPIGWRHRDPAIAKIVSEISQERIADIMKKLGSFETRNTLSDPNQPNRGVGAARQWVFDQLQSYSPRLQVSFDTHQIPKGGRVWKPVELRNVVAILPGTSDKDRWIIVSGHYDSLNLKVPPEMRGHPEQAAELPAPGVSDDASGVACAMECARILSQYEFPATLVFVAFAGEEQGLVGARAMARRLKGNNQEIEAVLNNDIIGTEVAGDGHSENNRVLVFSEDPDDSPSRQLARFVRLMGERYFPEMKVEMIFRRDRFGRGGDQTAFNESGYPGVRFTTCNEDFANQHSPTDTFENASAPYVTRVVRINAAAAAALALAPRPPVTHAPAVELRNRPGITRGTGYDAVLRWGESHAGPDVAGFVVVSRSTTAPDWEQEYWAGNVREHTLKDTPIDQLVLGVKAVDKAGHESPVSPYLLPPPLRGATAD